MPEKITAESSKNLSPEDIKQIYSELKHKKTVSGRAVTILGRTIGFFDNLIKKIQKNSEVSQKYGCSRKELKHLLKERVKNNVTDLKQTLEELDATLKGIEENPQQDFSSIAMIYDIISKIDKQLEIYKQIPFKEDKKKDTDVLQLFRACHAAIEEIKSKSQNCMTNINRSSTEKQLIEIKSNFEKYNEFLPAELSKTIEEAIQAVEDQLKTQKTASSAQSAENAVAAKETGQTVNEEEAPPPPQPRSDAAFTRIDKEAIAPFIVEPEEQPKAAL